MNIHELLMNDDSKNKYNPKNLAYLCSVWLSNYSEKYNVPYKINISEKAILKNILIEFGLELSELAINYYFKNIDKNNWGKNSYASIKHFAAYKRAIFPEASKWSKISLNNTNIDKNKIFWEE